jgi:hypothetical protein
LRRPFSLCAGVFGCGGAAICCQRSQPGNYPLMSRIQHWKSFPVLPMFQTSPIGAVPGIPGDARPNAARV